MRLPLPWWQTPHIRRRRKSPRRRACRPANTSRSWCCSSWPRTRSRPSRWLPCTSSTSTSSSANVRSRPSGVVLANSSLRFFFNGSRMCSLSRQICGSCVGNDVTDTTLLDRACARVPTKIFLNIVPTALVTRPPGGGFMKHFTPYWAARFPSMSNETICL